MISSVSQSVKQSYSGMPTVTKRRLSEAHQRSFWVYIAVHTLPSTLFLPHVVCLHASFLPLSRPLQLLLFVLLSSSSSSSPPPPPARPGVHATTGFLLKSLMDRDLSGGDWA